MKLTLVVACALIDADGRVLVTQRPRARRWRASGSSPAASWSRASAPRRR